MATESSSSGKGDFLNNLGRVLWNLKKFHEAELKHREALAIHRKILSPNHPALAASLEGLAIALQHQRKPAEAEACYYEDLAIRQKVWPDDCTQWQPCLQYLLDTLGYERKYDEICQLIERLSTPTFLKQPIGKRLTGLLHDRQIRRNQRQFRVQFAAKQTL